MPREGATNTSQAPPPGAQVTFTGRGNFLYATPSPSGSVLELHTHFFDGGCSRYSSPVVDRVAQAKYIPQEGFTAPFSAALRPASRLPVVLDSTGKVIGPLMRQKVLLKLTPSNDIIAVRVYPEGFYPTVFLGDDADFYYTTSDCSGTTYMAAGLPPVAIYKVNGGGVFFYAGANAKMLTINSFVNPSRSGCGTLSLGTLYVAPAKHVTTMSQGGYSPPFSAALRSEVP